MPRYFLLVTKTRSGSNVSVGTRYDLVRNTIIGNGEGAGLRLDDRWLAEEHASVRLAGEKIWLENRGRKKTRVNRLAIDGPAELRLGDHVHMGGVTFRVELLEDDVELRKTVNVSADEPDLIVTTAAATLFGTELELPKACLLALRAFALRPNEWLTDRDVALEVWGPGWPRKVESLGKILGILRRGCITPLDPVGLERMRLAVTAQADDKTKMHRLPEMSPPPLSREFIKTHRELGHRLLLAPNRVRVE
jgi:hypothetical protein